MPIPDKMLAVTVEGGKKAITVDRPRSPEPGEVLIRVERVGICGTDLEMFEGYTDFRGIIGHEFAGTVVEADLYSWIRRRVTASINLPDGALGTIDEDAAKHTPNRKALGIRGMDGAMADYVLLPEGLLVSLPDSVSWAEGAMAEPLAAAMNAVEQLPPGENPVLLVGDGKLAQLIARVYLSQGGELHVVGRSDAKLTMLEKAGAKVLDGAAKAGEYHRVIEATGSAVGMQSALAATAPQGTVVCKSTIAGSTELDLSRLVVDEITLRGSRCGSVKQAVEAIASGRNRVEDLVSDVFPLRDANKAFKRAVEPDALKVQLSPHGA
ncbi:alcohol dehydrogenase catalytic domain-containing protein [bacterium]|nr:alcohol dehydrogenase catalytic domain-containing protein [bacterium]